MKRHVWWAGMAVLVVGSVFFTGCYTVVQMPRAEKTRIIEKERVVYEEDEEDVIEGTVINKYYIYGDVWTDYSGFDPFWISPSWYRYRFSWGWYTSPSFWDPFWWDPWPYYGSWTVYWMYGPGYYYHPWRYWDPYGVYWWGYYAPEPLKRRPFDRRDGVYAGGGQYVPVSRSPEGVATGGRGLGKAMPSGSEGAPGLPSRSVRRDPNRTTGGEMGRSPSPRRIETSSNQETPPPAPPSRRSVSERRKESVQAPPPVEKRDVSSERQHEHRSASPERSAPSSTRSEGRSDQGGSRGSSGSSSKGSGGDSGARRSRR